MTSLMWLRAVTSTSEGLRTIVPEQRLVHFHWHLHSHHSANPSTVGGRGYRCAGVGRGSGDERITWQVKESMQQDRALSYLSP